MPNYPLGGLHSLTSLSLRSSLGAGIEPSEILNSSRMFRWTSAYDVFRFPELAAAQMPAHQIFLTKPRLAMFSRGTLLTIHRS